MRRYRVTEALIYKWRWRFLNGVNLLWVSLIKSCHGSGGGFSLSSSYRLKSGVWMRMVNLVWNLHNNGKIPFDSMRRQVGNGVSIRFWLDVWVGDIILKARFLWLFAMAVNGEAVISDYWVGNSWEIPWRRSISGGVLESHLQQLHEMLDSVHITDRIDLWRWSLGVEDMFSVKSARSRLDLMSFSMGDSPTRWNISLPIKINIFIWRLILNRLPTRSNLHHRGIDVSTILCPCCGEVIEDGVHLFLKCSMTRQLWLKFARWIDLTVPSFNSIEDVFEWIDSEVVANARRLIIDTTCATLIWVLWTYRNALVFGIVKYKKELMFDSIVSFSFNWFCSMNRKVKKTITGWLQNPLMN
uniref:Reverse transcriptase zinc-binding domain-containing protein n=1 Tax=Lactuca sativa TaxID=4236 RepID=A0A9R1VP08_LACSA|nr:hypothetical protein LSAT_V11C400207080 [Lactuca sativa]